MAIILTHENQDLYINDTNNIIIDFGASWCAPCNEFKPIFEKVSLNYPDIVFLSVDVNKMDELASEYDVNSLPTIIFIKEGNEIVRFTGKKTEHDFKIIIENNFYKNKEN